VRDRERYDDTEDQDSFDEALHAWPANPTAGPGSSARPPRPHLEKPRLILVLSTSLALALACGGAEDASEALFDEVAATTEPVSEPEPLTKDCCCALGADIAHPEPDTWRTMDRMECQSVEGLCQETHDKCETQAEPEVEAEAAPVPQPRPGPRAGKIGKKKPGFEGAKNH